VSLAAPVILVPFTSVGDDTREVWFLNLGVLKVKTPDALIKNPESSEYDEYEI